MEGFEIDLEEIKIYERYLNEMQEELDELHSMLAYMKETEEGELPNYGYKELLIEMKRRPGRGDDLISGEHSVGLLTLNNL